VRELPNLPLQDSLRSLKGQPLSAFTTERVAEGGILAVESGSALEVPRLAASGHTSRNRMPASRYRSKRLPASPSADRRGRHGRINEAAGPLIRMTPP
jgi:hypothetical protein